jgi:hypothetical protein
MTPQYTYDNKGNAVGVFLPIDDWNLLKDKYSALDILAELPDWQKLLLDNRFEILQQHPEQVGLLDDFLKEMEQEADSAL